MSAIKKNVEFLIKFGPDFRSNKLPALQFFFARITLRSLKTIRK